MAMIIAYPQVFAALLLAAAHSPAFGATPSPVTGHFLDIPALLENRSETSSSALLSKVKAPRLELRKTYDAYRVSSAMLVDEQDQPGGFIVVVNKDDGSFTALIDTSAHKGLVTGDADGVQTFREEPATDAQSKDYVTDPQLELGHQRKLAESPPAANDEQPYVLTVLAGFSDEAVRQVGDPRRFALAQIETLNLALRNSGLENFSIALAGISTTPTDYVINAANLDRMRTIFPNYPKADLIAGFFASPTEEAIGIANRLGMYSMTHISTTSTFAHEIGHNIGGWHCPSTFQSYESGYTTGKYGSLLCRQGSPILSFSNPQRMAPDGTPLGNPQTADMARAWRTNAPGKIGGESHDMTRPALVHSLAATNECLDVLDGKMEQGAKVGLWKCNPNNPNQRWYMTFFNDRIQFQLAAKPSLCLWANPAGGSDRELVLENTGCSTIHWRAEGRALKIQGNGEDLYLFRTNDNRPFATTGPPGESTPGFFWGTSPAQ